MTIYECNHCDSRNASDRYLADSGFRLWVDDVSYDDRHFCDDCWRKIFNEILLKNRKMLREHRNNLRRSNRELRSPSKTRARRRKSRLDAE